MIVQYHRNDDRSLKGIVVALDNGIIGWSLCNRRDKFNKEKGLEIAIRRAEKSSILTPAKLRKYYEAIPQSMRDTSYFVLERSKRYFK